MDLLPVELKIRLPPLLSQEADYEPIVYARYFLAGTCRSWYVIEGEVEDGDFGFFGFVSGTSDEFGRFLLSELQSARGPNGETVQRDLNFVEGKLTDVVPAPDV
ncbi:MAG TPA: DUF2958 domain-containing protein [Candidatus Sulfotelmatobacter sp.]|jgi:hypothetical protein|nr:DUF2958 domain-containing protein [Candidatus Sulfotelmatobacter sp.]